jgi:hypothetical protein
VVVLPQQARVVEVLQHSPGIAEVLVEQLEPSVVRAVVEEEVRQVLFATTQLHRFFLLQVELVVELVTAIKRQELTIREPVVALSAERLVVPVVRVTCAPSQMMEAVVVVVVVERTVAQVDGYSVPMQVLGNAKELEAIAERIL